MTLKQLCSTITFRKLLSKYLQYLEKKPNKVSLLSQICKYVNVQYSTTFFL